VRPFHYAFKVVDLESTKSFYIDILGCQAGRFTSIMDRLRLLWEPIVGARER